MQDVEKIVQNMRDAGCGEAAVSQARRLYLAGDEKDLLRLLRRCRGSLLEEVHQCQRKLDCLDHLIYQRERGNKSCRERWR